MTELDFRCERGTSMTTTIEATPPRQVLCIGNPDALIEVTQWLARHGLEPTWALGGDLIAAIATEDVLDGLCTAPEATAVQHVRALDLPFIGVRDASRFGLLAAS